MKTALKILLVCLSFLILTNSCYSGEGESERYGKPAHEIRDVHNYYGIKASSGIEVILTMGNSERVEIQAGDQIIQKVYTEVHNGVLEIGIKFGSWHNTSHESIKAYVSATQISSLNTSSAANISSTNTIKGKNLKLDASSGSTIKIDLQEEAVQAETSSGANMILTGTTQNSNLEAASGSSIKSSELVSEYAKASASSGAEIHLLAKKSLVGEASSGGSVNYRGNPAQVEKNKSSGGSVEQE